MLSALELNQAPRLTFDGERVQEVRLGRRVLAVLAQPLRARVRNVCSATPNTTSYSINIRSILQDAATFVGHARVLVRRQRFLHVGRALRATGDGMKGQKLEGRA